MNKADRDNLSNGLRETTIFEASMDGHVEVVKLLLENILDGNKEVGTALNGAGGRCLAVG